MMISILIPTSKRPNMFRNMLESLKATTQGWDIEVVAVIDNDSESEDIAYRMKLDIIDYSDHMRGALWCWNRALYLSGGDIIVPAGDDQIFHPDWLKYAMESHSTQVGGNGVIGMNDLAYNGNIQLATMFLFDRAYCTEHMGGIFAPPMYHYYNIDSEWNEKAKMLGKFYWDERSIVEHLHSAHGKREFDLHDKQREDSGWMEIDNKTFEERKSQGFPVTWVGII